MGKEGRCMYDDLFTEETSRDAIKKVREDILAYGMRNYGAHLKKRDAERIRDQTERGGYAAHLLFVILMLTHNAALREQIEDTADPEVIDKVKGFYRVMAIATRSIYVSPFTERSVRRMALGVIRFCFMAWRCFDADGMARLCDWYSARCE
jgi:hypothetical protein